MECLACSHQIKQMWVVRVIVFFYETVETSMTLYLAVERVLYSMYPTRLGAFLRLYPS